MRAMGELGTTSEMMIEAHRRAARHAQLPTWHPVNGGLAMAAALAAPMIIFASANAGVSLYALVASAAIGFAWGFFRLKRQKDAYDRAWNRELKYLREKIDREKIDAPRP
jgi:hypothetical protein